VLTDDDYTERYIRSEQTARNLHILFATKRIVFVGFSLGDPELTYLLRLVKGSMGSQLGPRHFAILALNEAEQIELLERQRLNHLYGIQPVYYALDDTHTGLENIIGELRARQDGVERAPGSPPRVGSAAGATRGIGPAAKKAPRKKAPGPSLAAKPALESAVIETSQRIDPDDPLKGRWGGRPENNYRRLSATVTEVEGRKGWFEIELVVQSTDQALHPLSGYVRFHLHPTFVPAVCQVEVDSQGVARMTRWGYGAFTVGVEADQGKTTLELDLSKLEGAPREFREN
jgi:prokaryotic YEATS domain/SIR2-like domain